jgi:flagellar motor switch protein FliM
MTKNPTLSGEEISALMHELRDQEPKGGRAPGTARPFAFGSEAARPMSALPALDRMNERMVRRLRDLVEPFARTKPRVAAEPTRIRTYGDWQSEQPEFTSLSLFGFKPLKGAILLSIEPSFVTRLVDAFYGGSGEPVSHRAREFTATEESLLARLAEGLITALADVWSEVVPVRPHLRSRETNVGFAGLARAEDPVALCRFTLTPWPGQSSVIEILYPVASLRSVEHELVAKAQDDTNARGAEWRERLATAVGEVRVKARTVLARPQLSLSELMQLQPGDVIPVSLPTRVPLLVEGRRIAVGAVGEHDGRAALKIEKMEQRRAIA